MPVQVRSDLAQALHQRFRDKKDLLRFATTVLVSLLQLIFVTVPPASAGEYMPGHVSAGDSLQREECADPGLLLDHTGAEPPRVVAEEAVAHL